MRRVVLDECLPRKLRTLLVGHNVVTVPEAGLAGFKNGKLLAAIPGGFDVFVTIDANLEYQQNLMDLDFVIVVVHAPTNRFPDIAPLETELAEAVANTQMGQLAQVPAQR